MMRSSVRLLRWCLVAAVVWGGCSGGDGDGQSAGAGGNAGMGGGGRGGAGGNQTCTVDLDCDDDNQCTADVCTEDGLCENTPVAEGSACAGGLCVTGSCEPVTSVLPCSEAGILEAVTLGGGPYGFSCDGPQTIVTSQEIFIETDVILDGLEVLTLDGAQAHRLFTVPEGVTAELRRLSIVRGAPSEGGGGGILNRGSLTLSRATISDNTAKTLGGGILNFGTMTLIDSTVSGNTSGTDGGGIQNTSQLTLTASTVSGNATAAGGRGGGIVNTGTVTIADSVVSGNEADQGGGGISNSNVLMATNSTVSGNTAPTGGGIWNGSILQLDYCTIASNVGTEGLAVYNNTDPVPALVMVENTVLDGSCSGTPLDSMGYNVESPGNTCGLDQTTDAPGTSAGALELGPLADNGGPTQTHAIGEGSTARDAIPVAVCEIETDQRGVARPQGDACDIGSFEADVQ